MIVRTLAIVFFVLVCSQVFAQDGRTIQEENGEKYFIHEVEQGHTLYAISKLYQVEIEDIVQQNPQVEEGLKIGQVLKIKVPDDSSSDRWENPIGIEDGYLIHRVKRKETLFGISQDYGIDINDLLELNPSLNDGLKKNKEIRIPKKAKIKSGTEVGTTPVIKDSLRRHKVQPNETLYSISKRYDVSMEDIQRVNGGLEEGLIAGEAIRIPDSGNVRSKTTPKRSQINIDLDTTSVYPKEFKIAVLMPFYLQYLDSADVPRKEARLQEIAMSFYRGVNAGADSLKKWGMDAEVIVADINDDLTEIHSRLNSENLEDADLVMGPLQRDAIQLVADYYKNSPAHIVVPVPQPNKILLERENLSEVVPSDVTQMREMAKVVARRHSEHNIILVNGGNRANDRMYDAFSNTLRDVFASDSILVIGEVKEVIADEKSLAGLADKLNPVRKNVIIAPCTDKAIIADLIRRAGAVNERDFDITIYGTSEWMGYDFFDFPARNQFNLHVPAYSMIDFENPKVVKFIRAFREEYNTEPDEYAFLGYDIFRFYSQGLLKYGRKFPNYFDKLSETNLLSTGFDYYKTGVESGFENQHIYILEYEDNQLKREAN